MTSSAEPWTGAELGLYLHLPFCLRKCLYCSFFSLSAEGGQIHRYVQALGRQIAATTPPRPITSVFFGGGTPSILPATELAELLRACLSRFPLAEAEIETTVEVNPATVDGGGLGLLRSAGCNRLSVGVQSLADAELAVLGRPHDAAAARAVVAAARRAGFANLNLDLMYGLPGQKVGGWRQTLRAALAMEPEHLALYELTVEEDTPFARLKAEGQLALPPEEEVLAMMAVTAEETAAAGFDRYEISNYARPGRECRHNLNYWHNGDYLGLGAGAVACLGGRRSAAVRDIEDYCSQIEAGAAPWVEMEELDREARFRETVVMGLRLTAGISLTELERRFGLRAEEYYGPSLRRLGEQGLVVVAGDRLRFTAIGLALANQVMAELV